MSKIKVALCQMKLSFRNKSKNVDKAISMIKKASSKGADLAILPEMFNCPDKKKYFEFAEVLSDSETLNKISIVAKEEKIYVLAGSIPESHEDGEKIYNTSVLFDDNGKIIAVHRKLHLYDNNLKWPFSYKESDFVAAGNDITVVDTKLGKFGIGICYDISFIEISRIMALKGAQVLIFPADFNVVNGSTHWDLLFRSRASDNQVFTIGVGHALGGSYGHSVIVNPYGKIISQAGYNEKLLIHEIDLDDISKARNDFPILDHRREDLYDVVTKF